MGIDSKPLPTMSYLQMGIPDSKPASSKSIRSTPSPTQASNTQTSKSKTLPLRRASVSSERSVAESEKSAVVRKRSSVDESGTSARGNNMKRMRSVSESSDTQFSRRTSDQESVCTRGYSWRYRIGDKVWATSYMDGTIYEAKVAQI